MEIKLFKFSQKCSFSHKIKISDKFIFLRHIKPHHSICQFMSCYGWYVFNLLHREREREETQNYYFIIFIKIQKIKRNNNMYVSMRGLCNRYFVDFFL